MACVFDIANCFLFLDDLHDGDGITNMKLQKLVYYAQGFFVALNQGKPLFNDSLEAWAHGPVVPLLYHEFKKYGKGHIRYEPGQFDPALLVSNEYELVAEVYEVFGQFSAWKLRNMTHDEPPWLNNERQAGVIPLTEIQAYFTTRIH